LQKFNRDASSGDFSDKKYYNLFRVQQQQATIIFHHAEYIQNTE
jgi:hypothetical protein